METQTKINSAIVAILLMIAGYSIVGEDLESTHYCEEREIKAFCYSMSSTMKTCYTEMNRTGGKRCDVWKEIGSVEVEVNPIIPVNAGVDVWRCDQSNCTPIQNNER
jgi:hypothetical protein